MVIAVLDDLMFTSKIRAAATHLGVPLTVSRTRDQAIAAIREQPPALVILDLNGMRTDPLGLAVAIKGDPHLRPTPIVGFVSHVQTELIQAARSAGVDQILARSAFVEKLADILRQSTRFDVR